VCVCVCKLGELKLTLGKQQWYTKAVRNLEIVCKIFHYFRSKVRSTPADDTERCTGHVEWYRSGTSSNLTMTRKWQRSSSNSCQCWAVRLSCIVECPDTRSWRTEWMCTAQRALSVEK